MGRHTGKKSKRRDGAPRVKMAHSPIGTKGLPPTEPQRNYSVEAAVRNLDMRQAIRRQFIESARFARAMKREMDEAQKRRAA